MFISVESITWSSSRIYGDEGSVPKNKKKKLLTSKIIIRRGLQLRSITHVTNFMKKLPQENVWAERITKKMEKFGVLHNEVHRNWITVQVK